MLKKKRNYEKAVAPVIGFMLLLAIVFLAAAQYQANVVPAQERSTEIDHFSDVTEDISGLRSMIIQTASTGQIQTQSIDIGTSYDLLGLSQPPRSGSLTYVNQSSDIIVENAQNNREASNFWRGDVDRDYETGYIEYRIDYNRIQDHADIYLEHGFMYRDTARGSDEEINMLEESEQPIVNGRTITLYTIQSSMDISRIGSDTIEAQPISAPMNSVSINNVDDDNPIKIQLPTRLSVADWESILCDETIEDYEPEDENLNCDSDDGFIEEINTGDDDDTIELVFEKDETYNLQMSRIDLRSQSDRGTTAITEQQYIAVDRQSANVREDSSIQLDAEVRDKYNNGVLGVPVSVEAQDTSQECVGDFTGVSSAGTTNCDNIGDFRQPGEDISSSDGSVTFEYNAPETEEDRDVSFIYTMDD